MSHKVRDEELKNQDKMTKNLFFEYERLQRRLEQLSDPLYPSELKRKTVELDARIRALIREQKALTIDQHRREKRLDKIISQGEPECFKDVQMAVRNLTALTNKYKTTQVQLTKAFECKDGQEVKQQEWIKRVTQVEQKA